MVKTQKRILALVLTLIMALSMPISAFAEAGSGTNAAGAQEQAATESIIVSQPQDTAVYLNDTAVFSVEASGKVRSYKWQYSVNGKKWKDVSGWYGGKTSTINIDASKSYENAQFRCIVTLKNGKTAVSSSAVLRIAEKELCPELKDTATVGDTTVEVNAPKGALPEGTALEIADANTSEVKAIIESSLDNASANYAAVDISFKNDGDEIEPVEGYQVEVTATMPGISEMSNPVLYHITDDGKMERVENAVFDGDTVKFANGTFSVYVVIEDPIVDPKSRLTVNFINPHLGGADDAANTVATVYVKNDDDSDQINKIVYDPGIGETLGENLLYRGWSIDAEDANTKDGAVVSPYGAAYDLNTIVFNIDDIHAYLLSLASANKIKEGDVLNIYAIILKTCTVSFSEEKKEKDEETGEETVIGTVNLGTHSVPMGLNDTSAEYLVNVGYIPLAKQKFMGWKITEGAENIVDPAGLANGDVIANNTTIRIKGDVKFEPSVEDGAWLVFNENGKGATYNAPQFVKAGEVTKIPRPNDQMERKGYTFGGWFTDAACTTAFTFGNTLTENTEIYAKWTAKTTAPYTIICWTQSVSSIGKTTLTKEDYDLQDSQVFTNGTVGQNIPYTSVENNDEDYATGVGSHMDGNTSVAHGHYTGFCLTEASKNQQVEITPEGDAVLNLYFDRIQYNFKFYLYRNGTQNNRYDYANNSGSGSDLNGLVTWHTGETEHPSVVGTTLQSESVGGRTYYYYVMQAYYGEDISGKWLTYDKINGANNRDAVSYVMMVGTKLKPRATTSGSGTVKGVISVLNENILGATNNANGNYVVVRFPGSYFNWRYHIWFETVEGETYPAGSTHEYNGKTYYEVDCDLTATGINPMEVRSSNTDERNQNEPKYAGFDYVMRVGQNQQGVWEDPNSITNTDENGHKTGEHWNTNANGDWIAHTDTTQNANTLYHLNYIYNRQQYTIAYFDGVYEGADGNVTHSELLHTSELIAYGADISEIGPAYNNPTPNASEKGFVFDGWYKDQGCKTPMVWTTMPEGSEPGAAAINVYAKWVQKQYRVFLHSNITSEEDPNGELSWGSSAQAMNFRGSYMKYISLPTGILDGYEFLGWYTDEEFNNYFDHQVVPMSDDLEDLSDYDKTVDLTDEMDKYGNIIESKTSDPSYKPWNSDATGNDGKDRFWITQKLDLYAKWKAVTNGALGIQVVYDSNGGGEAPVDDSYYDDNTKAYAQPATTPPAVAEGEKELQFKCWHVMKWDAGQNKFVDSGVTVLPGDDFIVHIADAKVEDIPGTTADDEINKKYTILLLAEYMPIDKPVPTHINWYQNEQGDAYKDPIHVSTSGDGSDSKDLAINEKTPIYDLTTDASFTVKRGHIFLGWSIQNEFVMDDKGNYLDKDGAITTDPDEFVVISYHEDVDEDDLDLYYNIEDGKYYADSAFTKEALGVAADEYMPYMALYAVWKDVIYIVHGSDKKVEVVDLADTEKERYEFTKGYDAETGYTDYYYGGYGLIADTDEEDPEGFTLTKGGSEASYTGSFEWKRTNAQKSGEAFTASTDASIVNAKKRSVGDVFYIKEVPSSYLAAPKIATVVSQYGSGELQNVTVISVIDTNIYRAGGINTTKGTFANSFTMTQTNGATRSTNAKDLFGLDGLLIINAWSTDEVANQKLVPYWTTYDTVTVVSNSSRTITISGNTVE